MTTKIEEALLRLPYRSGDEVWPDPTGFEQHVVVETRLGDVILFHRLEDLGDGVAHDDTLGIFLGHQLSLTHPYEISYDTWVVDRVGDELLIRHSPGRISSSVRIIRTPRATIDRVEERGPTPRTHEPRLRLA